jgi:hypothetical protein
MTVSTRSRRRSRISRARPRTAACNVTGSAALPKTAHDKPAKQPFALPQVRRLGPSSASWRRRPYPHHANRQRYPFGGLPKNHDGPTPAGAAVSLTRACRGHRIEYPLTKANHPWTNGQFESMNRALQEATVEAWFNPRAGVFESAFLRKSSNPIAPKND